MQLPSMISCPSRYSHRDDLKLDMERRLGTALYLKMYFQIHFQVEDLDSPLYNVLDIATWKAFGK